MPNLKAIAGNIAHQAIGHKKPLAITTLAIGVLAALGVVLHLYLNLISAICVPLGLLILSGGAAAFYKKIKHPTVDPDLDKDPPSADRTLKPSPSDEIARAAEQEKQKELQRAYAQFPPIHREERLDLPLIIMPNNSSVDTEKYLGKHGLSLEPGESLLVVRNKRILLAFRSHQGLFQRHEMIKGVSEFPLNESQIEMLCKRLKEKSTRWNLRPR